MSFLLPLLISAQINAGDVAVPTPGGDVWRATVKTVDADCHVTDSKKKWKQLSFNISGGRGYLDAKGYLASTKQVLTIESDNLNLFPKQVSDYGAGGGFGFKLEKKREIWIRTADRIFSGWDDFDESSWRSIVIHVRQYGYDQELLFGYCDIDLARQLPLSEEEKKKVAAQ